MMKALAQRPLVLILAVTLSGCGETDGDPCAAVDCSGRGRCAVREGAAVCLCDPGYVPVAVECVSDPCTDFVCVHGSCEAPGGVAVCTCEPGYRGSRCDACAEEFHPDGLACVPDAPCDDIVCIHGTCRLMDGEPLCDCSIGYAGDQCDQCAPGYHADGLGCVRNSACDPDPCVHGSCTDLNGTAVCACEAGYAGDRCDRCAEGFVPDGLACVAEHATPCDPNPCTGLHRTVCVPDGDSYTCRCDPGTHDEGGVCVVDTECDPQTTCSGHGTCTGAGLECQCDTGYAGPHCERCASGYQDNDQDGTCLENCQTSGLACPEGQLCDDHTGTPACVEATAPPIYISFLWHMHQPIYWPYESIVETEASGILGYSLFTIHLDRSGPYTSWPRDAIDAGRDLPHLGAQVSFSGSLMENLTGLEAAGVGFAGWRAPWIEATGWSTAMGNPRLDLVQFGYHHPLMGLLDVTDIRLQMEIHRVAIAENFGAPVSRGIFPPECAFSGRMIPALAAEGIQWVLVDNIHFDRAHVDYPYRPESNLPPPNPADQINTADTSWVQLNGLWAPSQVSAPWGYQPHWVQATDPDTGEVSRIIAVPAARYEGNEDARGGFGALQYEAVLSQYEHLNTDPLHPMLIVLHHDGDNYGGGTDSYYHANFLNFVSWLRANPDRFVATTIQDYLDRFPPDPDDVIHVEDGAWSGADNGDPEFQKWNGDPDDDGYSPDRNSWAVVTAVKNRVLTAEAIQPHSSASAVIDGTGNDTDRAWRHLLNAETSCYWYWDNSMNGIWDSHPTRAANPAAVFADAVLEAGVDTVGPTIYLPQREPYNPGTGDAASAFTVWTYVYDVSGLAYVHLHVRVDADGVRDGANDLIAGGTWLQLPMSGVPLPSFTDPMPLYKAEEFSAVIDASSGQLLDYYVSAEDHLGNLSRSPLLHVQVGTGGSQPGDLWEPEQPTADDVITVRWNQPANLHWGVDAGLHGGQWSPPPPEYWPPGSFLWSDGLAIETPLEGPDAEGGYSIQIGPFNQTPVAEVNFLFHNDDGTWSSPDHTIPIAE